MLWKGSIISLHSIYEKLTFSSSTTDRVSIGTEESVSAPSSSHAVELDEGEVLKATSHAEEKKEPTAQDMRPPSHGSRTSVVIEEDDHADTPQSNCLSRHSMCDCGPSCTQTMLCKVQDHCTHHNSSNHVNCYDSQLTSSLWPSSETPHQQAEESHVKLTDQGLEYINAIEDTLSGISFDMKLQ